MANQTRESESLSLAAINYDGITGATKDCVDAVARRIHYGPRLVSGTLLSFRNEHALLLKDVYGDLLAIKTGFASGYGGEGPSGLSFVLSFLDHFDVDLDEIECSQGFLRRLDHSALTIADIDWVQEQPVVRPRRIFDYVLKLHHERLHAGQICVDLSPVMPFAIVDPRIADLAKDFWSDPDHSLTLGYRRLEDTVRTRTGLRDYSARLYSAAFHGSASKLCWNDVSENEQKGRANLFVGANLAHRNPRAHSEKCEQSDVVLSEFLLLNHLFRLEASAVERE